MAKADFSPIVLGADTLGYSYAREFNRIYGTKSLVLSSVNMKYTSKSRFVNYEIVPDIDKEEVLVKWLKDNIGRFKKTPIVFGGTGDWRIRTLSKHKKELTELGYVIPNIDFELLDSISQKDIFYQDCAKVGAPFPKTLVWGFKGYRIENESENLKNVSDFELLKSLKYPLIAKPSNSADWHFADIPDQQKIYTIKEPEKLIQVIKDLEKSPYSHALLIQEMLSDRDEALHTVTTFSDAEGNILVGVTGDVILQSHTPTGIGNPLVILGGNKRLDLLAYVQLLLKSWRYEGFANFDVMDDEDGNPHFLEINTRAGRNTYYFSLASCPFVKPYIEYYVHGDKTLSCLSSEESTAENEFLFSMVSKEKAVSVATGENKKTIEKLFDRLGWQNPLFNDADGFMQKRAAKSYIKLTEAKFI
ncbi:MAG: ATP-dependent carboxylate-amine ligase [Firmicutes bacterium]|nr:ATP-dependent carboxylate-amine ligase [Bacillota bacterium]